jgi:hypothetical protein
MPRNQILKQHDILRFQRNAIHLAGLHRTALNSPVSSST